jgi:hypothetical protein
VRGQDVGEAAGDQAGAGLGAVAFVFQQGEGGVEGGGRTRKRVQTEQRREGELNLFALAARSGSITATGLRGRPRADKARIVRHVVDEVWPLVAAGRVRPVIDRRLPLSQAAEAHRVMEAGDHLGKIDLLAPESCPPTPESCPPTPESCPPTPESAI